MKKFYFLFIVLFSLTIYNQQIKQNPILFENTENPFVLSTTDDYYYVITKGKDLKINKTSAQKEEKANFLSSYIYIFDNSNNNYIYSNSLNKYYLINYNPFISYQEITVNEISKSGISTFTRIGGIAQNNEFLIYGIREHYLLFSLKSQYYRAYYYISDLNNNFLCKLIENENFVCAMFINNKLKVNCFNYQTYTNSRQDSLTLLTNQNSMEYDSISSFGLYDTDKNKNNIKILCRKNSQNIQCNFFEITINGKSSYSSKGDNKIIFATSDEFTEKNCYFSQFNSEYLFCCGITNYIKCFKINMNDYKVNKEFKISMDGNNSHLTIKSNDNYITLFFMNKYNGKNSIYGYYSYQPECQDQQYTILNSLNENKSEENWEKLSSLFIIKTNKYYLEINYNPDEFGFFTLNKEKVNSKVLINNNSYILDFIVSDIDKSTKYDKTFKYIVSV